VVVREHVTAVPVERKADGGEEGDEREPRRSRSRNRCVDVGSNGITSLT
jgi:hypothetical protein